MKLSSLPVPSVTNTSYFPGYRSSGGKLSLIIVVSRGSSTFSARACKAPGSSSLITTTISSSPPWGPDSVRYAPGGNCSGGGEDRA